MFLFVDSDQENKIYRYPQMQHHKKPNLPEKKKLIKKKFPYFDCVCGHGNESL